MPNNDTAAAAQPKFPPARAYTSTVRTDPARVRSAPAADPNSVRAPDVSLGSLKRRLRTAYQRWTEAAQGTREAFADEMGIPFTALKRWLSPSDDRPVPQAAVEAAEQLARTVIVVSVTDQEIAHAVRRLVAVFQALSQEEAA
jgi:hypothetical protein